MWLTGEEQRHRLKWIASKFCSWTVLTAAFPTATLYNLTNTIFYYAHIKQFHIVLPTHMKLVQAIPDWLRNPSKPFRNGFCRLLAVSYDL